jgi:hypothetical protein
MILTSGMSTKAALPLSLSAILEFIILLLSFNFAVDYNFGADPLINIASLLEWVPAVRKLVSLGIANFRMSLVGKRGSKVPDLT